MLSHLIVAGRHGKLARVNEASQNPRYGEIRKTNS
jgi:hypothetical protein